MEQETAETAKRKGNDAWKENRTEDAIHWYSKAIELDPNNQSKQLHLYYSNRSAAYCRAGNHQAALLDAEKCIELDSKWAKGYSRKGMALFSMDRLPAAAQAYSKALELDPSNEDTRRGLLDVQRRQIDGSSGGSGGGLSLQKTKEFLMMNKGRAVQNQLRVLILLCLLVFVLPLGALSLRAYRVLLMATLGTNAISAATAHGRIQFNLQYLGELLMDPATQYMMLSVLFLTQRPYVFGIVPLVLWESVQLGWFTSCLLYVAHPGLLRKLDARMDKYAPALFGIQGWSSKKVNERWLRVTSKVTEWNALAQVLFGGLLMAECLLPRRNVVLMVVYWQLLRTQYMLDRNGDIKRAFAMTDSRIRRTLGHPRCPSVIGSTYAKLAKWAGTFVEMPDPGAPGAGVQRPKCTIM